MIGDSHAALFAHGLGMEGCVKATYGTGSSIMAPVFSAQSEVSALATTIARHDADTTVYGLEGNIPHTGDAVAWMADSTGLSELPEEQLLHELNTLPATVDSTLGVYFVPALTGLGAPGGMKMPGVDSRSQPRSETRTSGTCGTGVDYLSDCRCCFSDAPAQRFSTQRVNG